MLARPSPSQLRPDEQAPNLNQTHTHCGSERAHCLLAARTFAWTKCSHVGHSGGGCRLLGRIRFKARIEPAHLCGFRCVAVLLLLLLPHKQVARARALASPAACLRRKSKHAHVARIIGSASVRTRALYRAHLLALTCKARYEVCVCVCVARLRRTIEITRATNSHKSSHKHRYAVCVPYECCEARAHSQPVARARAKVDFLRCCQVTNECACLLSRSLACLLTLRVCLMLWAMRLSRAESGGGVDVEDKSAFD